MTVFLLIVTAFFSPAQPTVGDRITIDFRSGPVRLDPSGYEVVEQKGWRVVIRTFEPRPLILRGTIGDVRFDNLVLPIRSVLAPNDSMKPAPLEPPHKAAWPRGPWIAIAVAAASALAAWGILFWLVRSLAAASRPQPVIPPAERFRSEVMRLRRNAGTPMRWAELADATRRYLDAADSSLGIELTTSQLLPRLDTERRSLVASILREGDLEKFSPWGATRHDFDELAAAALTIPEWFEPRIEEQAA